MAKVTKKDESISIDSVQPVEEFTPDDVAVMELIEELGGESTARVRIYRQGKTYTDITLIHECAPTEFDPMMLAHPPYNGGEFRIHVRSKNGFIANKALKVAPAADAITPGVAQLPQMQQIPQQSQGDILAIVRELVANQNAQTERLIIALKPIEQNPLQTLDGIKEIAKIISPAPPQSDGDSFGKTMKMFDTFMGLQERLKPAAKITDDEGEISVPNLLLTMFREFKNMNKSATPGAIAQTPGTPPEIAVNANGLTADQQQEIDDMQILLQAQLRQANKAAIAKADPAEYAENVYGIMPEDVIQLIGNDPAWFAEIVKIAPACAPHEAWYRAVGEKIKAMGVEDGLLTMPAPAGNTPADGNINAGSIPKP